MDCSSSDMWTVVALGILALFAAFVFWMFMTQYPGGDE